MESVEKRKYKRLPIKLDLSCRKAESAGHEIYLGSTKNVSPGGLYFEVATDVFKAGHLLRVDLLIPPTTGLLESGGSISGIGKVLRIHNVRSSDAESEESSLKSDVALEFCQPLKLRI